MTDEVESQGPEIANDPDESAGEATDEVPEASIQARPDIPPEE